ncbi:MAG: hypothetical protein ACLP8S_08545 [Solirubrobacteraceae bacterium]
MKKKFTATSRHTVVIDPQQVRRALRTFLQRRQQQTQITLDNRP